MISLKNLEMSVKKRSADALRLIEKDFGKGIDHDFRRTMQSKRYRIMSSGSLALDIAQVLVVIKRSDRRNLWSESSGKTTVALHAVAKHRKEKGHYALSMPSMPWIHLMQQLLGSISTNFSCLNQTQNKDLKLLVN